MNLLKAVSKHIYREPLYTFDDFIDKYFVHSTPWDRWRLYDAFFALKPSTYLHARHSAEAFIVESRDNHMARELFVEGESQLQKLFETRDILAREKGVDLRTWTIYDIGANIGVIGIPAVARGIFRDAVAIEPTPKTCRVLRANIALNGLEEKIRVYELALAAQDGVLELELSEDNTGDNRISVVADLNDYTEQSREKVAVPAARFDTLFAKADLEESLIWMDVQGFEGLALQGASRAIARRLPMVLEFWPYGMKRAASFAPLKEALRDYESFHVLGAHRPAEPIAALDALYAEVAGADVDHPDKDRVVDILVY